MYGINCQQSVYMLVCSVNVFKNRILLMQVTHRIRPGYT